MSFTKIWKTFVPDLNPSPTLFTSFVDQKSQEDNPKKIAPADDVKTTEVKDEFIAGDPLQNYKSLIG